ncbi:MAG: helix-turn-helix domain-containing protein [Clostridia bacterium]|nr:helix-turn-helix domain-containing protein [Clostridia bacterium]
MSEVKLTELRPRILNFYNIREGIIQRAAYPMKTVGRKSDAFIYILEGSMRYRFADREFVSKAGDILYLAAGSLYAMENMEQTYRYICADFTFALPDGMSPASDSHPMQNPKFIESLFRKMLENWILQKPCATEDCLSILYAVYAEILRLESASYVPISKRRILENAVLYIAEHLSDEELSVPEIADSVNMSESYFRRLFDEVYSVSPVQYINTLRINHAKELIRCTDESFTAIAAKVGFSNVYYFSRMFKKKAGCTPSEYRSICFDHPGI